MGSHIAKRLSSKTRESKHAIATSHPTRTPVPRIDPIPHSSRIQKSEFCPCDGGCPRCTTNDRSNISIGQPNDAYEQEADRTASQVIRMPEPFVQRQPMEEEEEEELMPKSIEGQFPMIQRQPMEEEEEELQAKSLDGQITPLIQRQPLEEEEEELMPKPLDSQATPQLQRQPMEEEEEELMAKSLDAQANTLIQRQCCAEEEESIQAQSPGQQASQQSIGSRVQHHANICPGKPLRGPTLNFFEPRFGRNFHDVRVHTCDKAVNMSNELNAQAFTYRNNIFFNSGRYDPESFEGKMLLGHELTHVLQQNDGIIQRKQQDIYPHSSGGATIVCDGEGGYEEDLGTLALTPCQMPYCHGLHEGVHCVDWLEEYPYGCYKNDRVTPKPRGAKVPTGTVSDAEYMKFWHGSEYRAFGMTARCAKSLLEDCDEECEDRLKEEINTAEKSRAAHKKGM